MDNQSESWFIQRLCQQGSKIAIIDNQNGVSYENLVEKSNEYLCEIKTSGIEIGAPIVLNSELTAYSLAMFLALIRRKNIITPCVTRNLVEIDERCRESYASHVVSIDSKGDVSIKLAKKEGGGHELFENIRRRNHSGLVLFSSGTTGNAKAMVHDLDNLINSFQDRRIRKLTILCVLMFDHIGGLNTILSAMASGSTLVVPQSYNADHLAELIQENRVRVLPASPTLLNILLISDVQSRYDLSSLRIVSYGTEPMPESLLSKLRRAFPGVKFIQTFGTSETGISHTVSKSSSSVYLKLDDESQEYRIENGELWLRTKTQVLGYLNHSNERFTHDGWFRTGDLVEKDDDGYLKIIGRNSDVINVGGEKVFPSEVESIILEIEGVKDCQVYGKENVITGQAVCAVIVMTEEAIEDSRLRMSIRKYCRTKLAPFKVPQIIKFQNKIEHSERLKKAR